MSTEIINSTVKNADTCTDKTTGEFEFYVKTLTGKSINISYDRNMSILNIKQHINSIENIPVEQQRLIFSGKQLEDSNTLGFYNIPSGSTIHLVLRLRG